MNFFNSLNQLARQSNMTNMLSPQNGCNISAKSCELTAFSALGGSFLYETLKKKEKREKTFNENSSFLLSKDESIFGAIESSQGGGFYHSAA